MAVEGKGVPGTCDTFNGMVPMNKVEVTSISVRLQRTVPPTFFQAQRSIDTCMTIHVMWDVV